MTTARDAAGVPSEGPGAAVLGPGEGHGFDIGTMRLTVKEAGERTAGQLVIVEIVVPAGSGSPPPHIHRRGGESWYVLEGELDVLAGSERGRYGPGSFVMVPAGTPHQFANPGSGPVRFLTTMSPYQLQFLQAVAQIWTAGPPDPAALVEVMARYDTELVRPG
jgi:mannose-6-phosphate isomerase-like protein (cupin superfamily)